MAKRFDRKIGKRLHFASAMTLLERTDGSGADNGVSYLEIVDFLCQNGSQVTRDLEQLWRRIVFNICVSNVDDHLRNHGFLLTEKGWKLAPAYDMNPVADGEGLKLNISATDNSQNIDLVLAVAENFRLKKAQARRVLNEVVVAVRQWKKTMGTRVSKSEISKMSRAFRVVASLE